MVLEAHSIAECLQMAKDNKDEIIVFIEGSEGEGMSAASDTYKQRITRQMANHMEETRKRLKEIPKWHLRN